MCSRCPRRSSRAARSPARAARRRPARRCRPGRGSATAPSRCRRSSPASVSSSPRKPRGMAATGLAAVQDDRVVRLDEEPAPAEVRRSAHDGLAPFGPSTTIVLLCCSLLMCCRFTLSAPAETARRARGRVSAESGSPWSPLSSMITFSRSPSCSRRATTSGSFRSYATTRTWAFLSAMRLVEDLEDRARAPRSPSTPALPSAFGCVGVKVEAVGGLRRQQLRDRPGGLVPVDEGLRRDEPAGEGDVELARDTSRAAARPPPPEDRRS